MKKQLIIVGVIIVLLMIGFSGCLEDSNKDKENGESPEINEFIGKWKTTIYYYDENGTRYNETSSNSIFYTNGTMGSESVVDNVSIWTPYVIENNQICIGEVNAEDYYCYDFEFSNNGTKVKLWTYITYSDYGETLLYIIEMVKD